MGEVLEGHIREHLGADDILPQQRSKDLEQTQKGAMDATEWLAWFLDTQSIRHSTRSTLC